jgi:hypothetical protein
MTTNLRPRARVTGDASLGLREVLGLPVLPPGSMMRLGNRVRAGLARTVRVAGPPPARVLEGALGVLDLAALHALCRIGVPDHLASPSTVEALADRLTVDPARLERLLRYAATRGFVRLDRHGQVRATSVTRFLRTDHPGGWRAWVEFAASPEVLAAVANLHAAMEGDGDAFAQAHGAPFFAWMAERPDRHARFDAAMAAGGRMHGVLLASELDWSTTHRICDVGGGDGALLGVLVDHHPTLEGVVLELPEVAARAPRRDRVEVVGGDAFEAVPRGCDTYLFVNVLHDWDDEAAVRLLERAAEALRADGARDHAQVVVVESEAHGRPRDDLAIRADLLMLALTPGGRERTTAELASLAARAGLRLRRTRRLASGDVAHVLVLAG